MNSMCRDNKRNSELCPNLTTTRRPEHAGLFSSSLYYSVHQQSNIIMPQTHMGS